MYRINEIVTALSPLVGWSEGATSIDKSITISQSGLYFQEAHPLLTLRAMRGIMPIDFIGRYAPYKQDFAYDEGIVVRYGEKVYKSLKSDNTALPTDKSWEEYDMLSDYLAWLRDCGIKKVIQKYVEDKVVGFQTRNLIDRRCFFDNVGNINARIENKGNMVGFEISPNKNGGAILKAEKVGLQFVGNIGEVKLYLFHSSESEPVWTKVVNYTAKNGTMQWFDLDDTFFACLRNNKEGSWYLCYNQSELPPFMEAINVQRDWSKTPCSTCNKGDAVMWAKLNQYVTVSPFYVDGEREEMWVDEEIMYTPGSNYGLNLQISLGCDLTDNILYFKDQFAHCIQLQVANDALRTLVYNPDVRVNRTQVNADRNDILYEVDGNGEGIKGLAGELAKAYKALSFTTEGISPMCLTCHNKGIRFGAI